MSTSVSLDTLCSLVQEGCTCLLNDDPKNLCLSACIPCVFSKGQAVSPGFCQICGELVSLEAETYPMMTKNDCGNPAVMSTTDVLCLFNKLNTSQVSPYWTFLCVWTSVNTMFLERRETSSVEQMMQEVLEENDVGSFVQLRSCCAYTRLVRVRDDLYLVRQIG